MDKPGTSRPSGESSTSLCTCGKPHNRLLYEKSPYLLQHAHNPVDWYPWGPEAFDKAAQLDRPIFLSIGYSTCHWCHVMEQECFQDPEIAGLLNELCISIKVDREERPDIDNLYMTACHLLTGRGGWPLSIFMTADKKPFFAGTYIPKASRPGTIGMRDLLPRIGHLWRTRRKELLDSSNRVLLALKQHGTTRPGPDLDLSLLERGFSELAREFDPQWGGFGQPPKFPSAHRLMFLLRYWNRTSEHAARRMVEQTLDAMRRGGIYDHLGHGFHRYSTDAQWLVPHFEKMLYDQAMLAIAYTEAFQATHAERFRKTAMELYSYVLSEMTSPSGGFFSAQDADAEGKEGTYYLWTVDDIVGTLGDCKTDLVIQAFGISREGNVVDPVFRGASGHNVLFEAYTREELSERTGVPIETIEYEIERARQKLLRTRSKRVAPFRDEKILTDWNGLMIAALSKGAQAFGMAELTEAAQKAADFVLATMWSKQRGLLHRYCDNEAAISGMLDDYAFLVWGLIELYETTFEQQYLRSALALTDEMITHFEDPTGGGFFLSAAHDNDCIVRQKEAVDGAYPSGNSVAFSNLVRLGSMTHNRFLEDKALALLHACASTLQQAPSWHCHLLSGLEFLWGPRYEIVISGDPEAEDTRHMLTALRTHFIPSKTVMLHPPSGHKLIGFVPSDIVGSRPMINGKATAYICTSAACLAQTNDVDVLLRTLGVDPTHQ